MYLFHRNAGTVRQLLESKRNVSEGPPPSFQTPVNTGNGVVVIVFDTSIHFPKKL
jgi:hypothetical protein